MKFVNLIVYSIIILSLFACDKMEEELTQAKPYQIVGEYNIQMNSDKRLAKSFYITSEANDFESFAQTTIKAAIDIHKKNRKLDLIRVSLVPDNEMVRTSIIYAFASYAVDGKGAKYVTGADQTTMVDYKWLVRSAEQPLTESELQMAILWYNHKQDFPSEDLLSSLSFNREKLVKFIADTLNINEDEVYLPHIVLKDYRE